MKLKCLLLVTGSIFAASQAFGGTITIGLPAPSQNCFPFNCFANVSGVRYQQVYAASAFSGTVAINGIEFYTSNTSAIVSQGSYQVSLSTTSQAVNGLDTSNLNNNDGADNTQVANWVLAAPLPVAGGSSFEIPLSTSFIYDSANGNLLLDIFISSQSGGSGSLAAWDGDTSAPFSRAMQCTGCGGSSGYGLATGFVTGEAAVPEPGTFGLLGIVLLAAPFFRRRR